MKLNNIKIDRFEDLTSKIDLQIEKILTISNQKLKVQRSDNKHLDI